MPQQSRSFEKTPRVEMTEKVDREMRPRSSNQLRSRRSWFGTRSDAAPTLPPLPAMPQLDQSEDSSDRRRSMAASRKRSSSSKRRSIWSSSNPDESDSDVPPVPALTRGGSHDSVSTLSRDSADAAYRNKQPTTTSTRRKYVPRSAAKSFLVTTSGASEDGKRSYRRSFKLDEEVDLVCSTEEQQIEWAKLMDARAAVRTQASSERVDSPFEEKHVNDRTLAALEFGTLR